MTAAPEIRELIEELEDHARMVAMLQHTSYEDHVAWRAKRALQEIFNPAQQPSRHGTILLARSTRETGSHHDLFPAGRPYPVEEDSVARVPQRSRRRA